MLSQGTARCCHFGFDRIGKSAIRSVEPENPVLEPNMKLITQITRYGDMAIRNLTSLGVHLGPPF